MAVSISNGWLWGDAPPFASGNRSAIVAASIRAINEEQTSTSGTARYTTYVRTVDGVTTFFDGRVGGDIVSLIPDPTVL